ncbi:MAG: cytochrome c [Terriglobales bacterium]
MTCKRTLGALLAGGLLALSPAVGQPSSNRAASSKAEKAVRNEPADDAMRVEGEKRFQANCGRCHQFPHKFPPRMILTVERHMRVRALITEEDMRVIIRYLTQ